MNHHPTNDNDYDYDNNYDDNYDDENGFAIAELGNNDTDTDRYTNKKKKNSNQSTIDVYTSTNTNTNMDTNDTTANANTNTNTNTITITNTNITNTITNTVRTTNSNADWSGDRKNSIKMAMAQKKEEDRYPVSEDVYAFLFVAPVFSGSFLFSLYVVAVKYTVYSILWKGVHPANEYKPENENDIDEYKAATAAKFFLIPVAIAMQEDLINCYFFFANVIYCESSALAISATATQRKLFFSYTLRLIDGLLSLAINVGVMLSTYATLAVFLNFAALSFLQSIDDVFYELVVKGFFGDKMEHMSTICNKITFKRRAGDDNFKICGFLKVGHLDTILFFGTCLVCLALYFWFTSVQHVRFRTLGTGGGNNSTNEQD